MTTLENWLIKACNLLGLSIEIGFAVPLSNGEFLRSVCRILSIGSENGMLVFRPYDEIQEYAKELVQKGYGYTVIDEPRSDEAFDLDSFKEMFADWGWNSGER